MGTKAVRVVSSISRYARLVTNRSKVMPVSDSGTIRLQSRASSRMRLLRNARTRSTVTFANETCHQRCRSQTAPARVVERGVDAGGLTAGKVEGLPLGRSRDMPDRISKHLRGVLSNLTPKADGTKQPRPKPKPESEPEPPVKTKQ